MMTSRAPARDLPPPPHAQAPRSGRWIGPAALAAWLAVNLGMVGDEFRGAVPAGGRPAPASVAVLLALPSALVLTAVGWAAFRMARRHTLTRRGLARSLARHAAAALALALLNTAVRVAERRVVTDYGRDFAAARDGEELAAVLVLYAALSVAAHAVEYARRHRRRQLDALRLRASLARAELERAAAELRVLKLQLHPHFLFNSLHAAAALVRTAPDAAGRVVLRLCDLLRHAVTRTATQEVPLAEEIRSLEPFLEVEQIRLGGRLTVRWAVDPAARGARVPHMVLQPLVENAIKHGLAGREGGGCVQVSARREGPWLELEVRDDGVGLAAAARRAAPGGGIGTANTRARLAHLYGAGQGLEIAPGNGGGTRVSLRIPWHEAPWPAPALDGAEAAAPVEGRVRRWPGRVAAAAVLLLLWRRTYGQMLGARVLPGRVVGAPEALVCGALDAAALTLLLSTAFVLARRAPVAPGGAAAVRRHARAALLLAMGMTLVRNACGIPWGTPASSLATPGALGRMAVHVVLWMAVYAVASLAAHALEYARRGRVSEAAALALQTSLARAELERTSAELRGLRMQVNPAYLFTTLEAVAARVHRAPADAERMVVRLADLLRQAMAGGEREVPLEEEVRAMEPFLEVERMRLEGRLRLEWRVDDDALDGYVPPLVLQPLVMEALHRGADAGPAAVEVAARRSGRWLELEVRGPARAADAPGAAGAGAAAELRARLEGLYGADCAVEVVAEEGETRTVLRLPWHEEPWTAGHEEAPR
ncbi:MAG TPA: histidine kinase [Longimicrobium sp.]|nr:histidine kinase [Longimicrobium sp.]